MTVRHVRHSKLIEAETTDMDARVGYWTRAEVVAMDERFCAAMRRALAGPERTAQERDGPTDPPARAASG